MNKNLERFYSARENKSHFLLFDLEANYTWEDENKSFETIQIGWLKCDHEFNVMKKGSIFVKPKNAFMLTDFIHELTGITQVQINSWMSFPDALREFTSLYNPESDYIMSYGYYDMKQIYGDCQVHSIAYPFDSWDTWKYDKHINIKNALAKKLDIREKGMGRLLEHLWLELIWKHHNGEDDCVNILSCVKEVFGK